MPSWVTPAVVLHVAAGASWLAASLALVLVRRPARGLLALQMATASTTILAGIHLWHTRHAGPQGPMEHLLTVGTVVALVALGLQVAVAAAGPSRVESRGKGRLVVSWLGLGLLTLAAAAMVAARST